jgi:hypothetical protein
MAIRSKSNSIYNYILEPEIKDNTCVLETFWVLDLNLLHY